MLARHIHPICVAIINAIEYHKMSIPHRLRSCPGLKDKDWDWANQTLPEYSTLTTTVVRPTASRGSPRNITRPS